MKEERHGATDCFCRSGGYRSFAQSHLPGLDRRGKSASSLHTLARSADGTSSVVAWSCSAGRFNWYYNVDETLHIISGAAFVIDERGEVHRLAPGDVVFFPAGSRSLWYIPKEVRKLAVCRHSMPRPVGLLLKIWNLLHSRLTGFPIGVAQLQERFGAELRGELDAESDDVGAASAARAAPAKAA